MKIIVKVHTPHITSGFFVAGSITTIMWKESLDIGYIMLCANSPCLWWIFRGKIWWTWQSYTSILGTGFKTLIDSEDFRYQSVSSQNPCLKDKGNALPLKGLGCPHHSPKIWIQSPGAAILSWYKNRFKINHTLGEEIEDQNATGFCRKASQNPANSSSQSHPETQSN